MTNKWIVVLALCASVGCGTVAGGMTGPASEKRQGANAGDSDDVECEDGVDAKTGLPCKDDDDEKDGDDVECEDGVDAKTGLPCEDDDKDEGDDDGEENDD